MVNLTFHFFGGKIGTLLVLFSLPPRAVLASRRDVLCTVFMDGYAYQMSPSDSITSPARAPGVFQIRVQKGIWAANGLKDERPRASSHDRLSARLIAN
jgi:hypothetical protein